MKKLVVVVLVMAVVFSATAAFALTDAQRAEQKRQQQAAQRAYQASADTYNDVARQAEVYHEGATTVRDASATAIYYGTGGKVDARSDE